jgi:hypothetical protein
LFIKGNLPLFDFDPFFIKGFFPAHPAQGVSMHFAYYSSLHSEPTLDSKTYSGPISDKGQIKLKVFSANGRRGRTTVIVNN